MDQTVPPGFVQPTQEAWDIAAEAGEKVVRDAIVRLVKRMGKRGGSQANHALIPGVLCGALVEITRINRAVCDPAEMHIVEQYWLAYVRGAIRGLDGPVHDDGRPFERAFDA